MKSVSETHKRVWSWSKISSTHMWRSKESFWEETQTKWLFSLLTCFEAKMTEPVLNVLKKYNICLVKVQANMTDIFQPLDLTINRSTKSFFKRKFTQWYFSQIQRGMECGKDIEKIEVKLNLTTLNLYMLLG